MNQSQYGTFVYLPFGRLGEGVLGREETAPGAVLASRVRCCTPQFPRGSKPQSMKLKQERLGSIDQQYPIFKNHAISAEYKQMHLGSCYQTRGLIIFLLNKTSKLPQNLRYGRVSSLIVSSFKYVVQSSGRPKAT